jgi:S-adenosylmethionine decarboxylase
MQIVKSSDPELEAPTEESGRQPCATGNEHLTAAKDHFILRDGIEFAGTHLLLDLWGAKYLDNIEHVENAMRECVDACGATLLHIHLHHFSPNGGISGVAILAESHISVHTWPERDYAAFDVFMCGDALPENSIAVLKRAFFPQRMKVFEELRGRTEQ